MIEGCDRARDLDSWLAPFLAAMARKTRRTWAPLYLRGLLGPGERKSLQPMAARLTLSGHDQLQHFIASPAWDDGPLWRELASEADRLVGEWRASGEHKYYLSNLPAETSLKQLASAIKARWVCEQAHQQLKEELGLDHFEGRSWTGLHRHALMACIAYAYLQHLRLSEPRGSGRGKNEAVPVRTTPVTELTSRAARHHRASVRMAHSAGPMPALPTTLPAVA